MGLARALMKAGYGTRRQTETIVEAGRITMDGKVVTDPRTKVDPGSEVQLDGAPLTRLRYSYYAFNKPSRVVCTTSDGPGSKLVTEFFPEEVIGLHPAGRLDRKTTGLILVSNDRPWNRKVTGSGNLDQEFRIQVEGELNNLEIGVMTAGVLLPNYGLFRPLAVQVVEILNGRTVLTMVVGEGKLRQVRRMLTTLRHKVVFVRRTRIGTIRLGELPVGRFRHLTSGEIAAVRSAAEGGLRGGRE
jgi:pseudouridine synthase